MIEKIVCFAGHRFEWKNLNIKDKLFTVIGELINEGYLIFYNGDKGYFDKICIDIVCYYKKFNSNIKLIKILTNYNSKLDLEVFDDSILPEIDMIHPKRRITERNKWMVEHSEVLVCHIVDTYKSGAYNTYKYARKLNKTIINI